MRSFKGGCIQFTGIGIKMSLVFDDNRLVVSGHDKYGISLISS